MRAFPLHRYLPAIFIFIWASGYVVAKYGLPYAEPLTFLCLRYAGVIIFMLVLAICMRAPWPERRAWLPIAVAGVLMQAVYLGGIWSAVKLGMPAGLAALIANIQPILTAVMGPMIGERIRGKQWLGLGLGIIGVGLVVANKMSVVHLSLHSVALAVMALLAMTCGTLYQKKTCPSFDVRTGQVLQFAASLLVTLPFALLLEKQVILWTPQFFAAMAWSIFILSGVGISVLFILIRHGEATKVTSYMYLVPAVTAAMAWLMFGEQFTATAAAGMAVALAGVALVVRPGRS
ncbi:MULTISPECIES: DMT family transporter [unclassified Undibacterium]|uniref:DMT family transporter n=1 Tax=unclassified Undibacterium TaxID=2630295 RepID=UPI002AC93F9F|nr:MULTISPECIES: DMT family transporter [unclassified Undibacterium]MEB0139773.1 DMT family transporter [Undibacterium sp. CCC2.1]MEB0170519.1 DMT family transporter [Undibacterium sp. CCC1.1]MEB0174460.1 DMT family transporter [Undibacterium sp. CCC3.4]MEB0213743.1 DMT family transporter [Undibacterium sp. 5I2]WPX43907.1 DMT family transporter [Undibacterium sp. CCC3.4]